MANNRSHGRLSTILSPSTFFSPSHTESRPTLPDAIPFSHKGGSRWRRVKSRGRSLHFFPSPLAVTNPLLPGPTASVPPLSASSRTSGGSDSSMSRPRRERPSHSETFSTVSRSSLGTTRPEGAGRRGQVTDTPKPKPPSEDSYSPTPVLSPALQKLPRSSRNRATLKRRASANAIHPLNRTSPTDGVEPRRATVSRSRSLWNSRKGLAAIGRDAQDGEYLPVNPLRGPLAEKQRVINVRRAKKMQQVRVGLRSLPFIFQS